MSESLSQFLFGLFIVSVFTLAVSLFFYYQSLRRKAFIDMAATMKLHFQYLSYGLPRRLGLLFQFRRGKNRYASNIITGRYKGQLVYLFDYHYTTGDKYSKVRHCQSVAILRHDLRVPEVRIYPPAFMEKVGNVAEYGKIQLHFDDEQFSKQFSVFASETTVLETVFQKPMIEYFLRHPDMSVEVGEGWIATCKEARHIPEEIPRRTEQLIKLHRVFSQVGGEGYRFAEVNTPSSFL